MKASFWVQIKAGTYRSGRVAAIRAARMTRERPREPLPGAVLVKVTLDVPEHVFAPLEAAATVEADQLEVIPAEIAEEPS